MDIFNFLSFGKKKKEEEERKKKKTSYRSFKIFDLELENTLVLNIEKNVRVFKGYPCKNVTIFFLNILWFQNILSIFFFKLAFSIGGGSIIR